MSCWQAYSTLLENLADDAIAWLSVTKLSIVSLYLTKLYVVQSFAIASTVTYSEIRQNLYSITVYSSHTAQCMYPRL